MCHLPASRNSEEEIEGLRSKEGAALQNESLMGWESRKPERRGQKEGDKKRNLANDGDSSSHMKCIMFLNLSIICV